MKQKFAGRLIKEALVNKNLTKCDKVVFIVLVTYATKNMIFFRIDAIAKAAGCKSNRIITKSLKRLCDNGYIKIICKKGLSINYEILNLTLDKNIKCI